MAKIAKLQEVAVSDLRPYERNAKIHGEAQIEKLKNSITAFGFLTPCLIDREMNIIAGHGRVMAAKELGMEKVPCVMIEDLTEEERRAYILADNRLGELGEWDMEAVDLELRDLDLSGFDISLTGFDFDFGEPEYTPQSDDFDPDAEVSSRVKKGDVWILGNHRLVCGDTTNPDDMAKLMDGNLADMVFTDPPYGVAIGTKNQHLNEIQMAGRVLQNIENDDIPIEELYDLLVAAFINIREHCKDDACYFVTAPSGGELGLMMLQMMKDSGLEVRHLLIWEKNSATFSIGRLDYDYKHEPIFYTWTKSHHNYRKGENRTTVWNYDKPRKCDLHPTMKPVELVANAMLDGTKEGDIVLDGFGGSGTTIIAAEQLNRRGFLMEIDPHYADVIIERWEIFTGEKAKLEN